MQAESQMQLLVVLCPTAPQRALAPVALLWLDRVQSPSIHRTSLWVSEAVSNTGPTQPPWIPPEVPEGSW